MEFLRTLGIAENNPGAYFGEGQWSSTDDSGIITAVNPATGETIATVNGASEEDYERVLRTAGDVFSHWRTIPAPQRGEAVRLCNEALRDNKNALGSLVREQSAFWSSQGDPTYPTFVLLEFL